MPCARSSNRIPTPRSSCAARWASRRSWSRRFRRGQRISWSSRSNRRASSRPCSGSSADSMDLSQYAELFLAESREHLSACNQLLLDWERTPANPAPVAGLFRAVHTVKGMAATMGYGRVTDIAHRTENLLDLLRRGSRPATDELLQLLFRARGALEHARGLSGGGRGGGGGGGGGWGRLGGARPRWPPLPPCPPPRGGEGGKGGVRPRRPRR